MKQEFVFKIVSQILETTLARGRREPSMLKLFMHAVKVNEVEVSRMNAKEDR